MKHLQKQFQKRKSEYKKLPVDYQNYVIICTELGKKFYSFIDKKNSVYDSENCDL